MLKRGTRSPQTRFALLMPMSLMFVRATVHPLSLVKTRLQMQRGHNHGLLESSGEGRHARYSGTIDAFRKIVRYEGVRGLFKVSSALFCHLLKLALSPGKHCIECLAGL